MSDRPATIASEMRQQLGDMAERVDDDELMRALRKAAHYLTIVEQRDRELNGATPEDKLVAYLIGDTCPNCGDDVDDGGWCSYSCMTEDLSNDGDGDE